MCQNTPAFIHEDIRVAENFACDSIHASTFRHALKNFSLLICEQRSAKKPWSWEFKSCFSLSDQRAAYNLGLKPLPLLENIFFCEIAMRLSYGRRNTFSLSIGNLKRVSHFSKK